MRGHHRGLGSVFWGLVFIALGSVLLLANLGYRIPIWESLATYWPVLIIAWGLVKLVDYYRLKGENRPLFSGGEVALLILVLMTGSAFTAATHTGSNLDFIGILGEDLDLFDLIGENFLFSSQIQAEAEQDASIEIHNIYGSVDVEPGEGNRIIVDVEKTVRAASREEAERLEPELVLSVGGQDGRYTVESNREELGPARRRRFKTSLRIQVPVASSVTVDNRYGIVRISGLTGNQEVRNKYGGVTIGDISGDIVVDDGYGPVVAENISGNAAVTNRYSSVTVSTIGGNATVDSRYGTVHVSGLGGDAHIVNRYALVSLEDVQGLSHVEGRNNSVDLENVGEVDVETSYKNVVVRNPTGPVRVANRHGDIGILFDTSPVNDIVVNGDYTNVRIELPSASEFSIDAQIRSGSFDSDFELDPVLSGRERRVEGRVGLEGPQITIQTNRGDVRLMSSD